jgi:hypothetical protein
MELCRLENILLIDRACEEDKKPEQFRTQQRASPLAKIQDKRYLFGVPGDHGCGTGTCNSNVKK